MEDHFFQKINLSVDHEPVGLKKNELHHEIQRGRISLRSIFNAVVPFFKKYRILVTTRLSLERDGLEQND